MNTHAHFEERLVRYAANQLDGAERIEVESHLAGCAECQADLALWTAVSGEIHSSNRSLIVPATLVDKALEQAYTQNGFGLACLRAWQLLRAQAMLVQREMWSASAIIMLLGVIVTLISKRTNVLYFLAPLVAASTLAMLSGPEYDPAYELSLAAPTSPWKILLARLSVVSAYNLLLALVASLLLLFIAPPGLIITLVLNWLGPLMFLSALALMLSIWLGTSNAITIVYGLWMLQFIPFNMLELWIDVSPFQSLIDAYQTFWHSPVLLLPLSIFIIAIALWSATRPVFRLTLSSS